MATTLSKPVSRALSTRHYALVVTIAAEGIYYREKGRRRAFLLPHGTAFLSAVKLQVAADKAAKAAAAAERRKARGPRGTARNR